LPDNNPLTQLSPTTPTQDKADMYNPRQFAAWVFAVGTPDSRKGFKDKFQPPLLPAQSWQAMSEVFWELGFRHHPSLQKKWVFPGNNWVPGRLVDKKPEPNVLDLETAVEFLQDTNPEIFDKIVKADPAELNKQGEEMRQKLLEIAQRAATLHGTLPETPEPDDAT
jgi:hypothetical protein